MSRLSKRERNDCAVRAIAFAVGVPYRVAHAALKEAGRRDRKGATDTDILAAIAMLGKSARMRTLTKNHRPRWRKFWLCQEGSYIVATRDHVCGVVDGFAVDAPKLKHRVEWVIEIS